MRLSVCIALTNFHIMKHPLQEEDSKYYKQIKKQKKDIAESKIKKQRLTQKKYRMAFKACLEATMFAQNEDDNESSDGNEGKSKKD